MRPAQEVSELRKAGRVDEAYQRGKDLLKEHPDDFGLKSSMGWVHFDRIKRIVGKAGGVLNASNANLRSELRDFARLNLPRNNTVYSNILLQLLHIKEDIEYLPNFVMWVGLDGFQPGDYLTHPGDTRPFPSRVEDLARKVAKGALKNHDLLPKVREFALSLVRHALEKSQMVDQPLLRYYEGRLLFSLGHTYEAREVLISVVRHKQDDFWVWRALANAVRADEPKAALPILARACLCKSEPERLASVFEDLAQLARELGHEGIALRAAQEAIAVRQRNGWKVSSSLQSLARTLAGVQPPADFRAELQALAKDAQTAIVADVPAQESNFVGTFEREDGRKMAKFAFRVGQRCEEVVGPAGRLLGDMRLNPGHPVLIRVQESEGRRQVLQVEARPSGRPFDQVERILGVLEGHKEGRAFAYLSPDLSLPLPYGTIPGVKDVPPGSSVALGCTRHKDRLYVHYCEKIIPFVSAYVGIRTGSVRLTPRGFGFVEDAFIPPGLASRLTDGQRVEATVVKKVDKKKGQLGWTVVALREPGR